MTTTYLSDAELSAAEIGPDVDGDLLGIYLGDHLTGATAGSSRISDMAERHADEPYGPDLARIAGEVERECATLEAVIRALDLSTHPVRRVVAKVGERVGSLKPNGRLIGESPMTPVLELDLVRAAVNGKGAGWEVLQHYADDLGLPKAVFTRLIEQSDEQSETLARAHAVATDLAFRKPTQTKD
ncbi:hypothetical protein C8046_13740 [Serinibacter arcticus]|uniref:DUF892 family protein n=1 Tax=Serinibacter arcticus TaxID=1655435 RepID=A0A2U1ZX38_9MICO|nr:hypothetical protein [Serinibacter arcticus]PWD51548.1 hypothetical protein C8046_13740 [Serinibacter arcticus]